MRLPLLLFSCLALALAAEDNEYDYDDYAEEGGAAPVIDLTGDADTGADLSGADTSLPAGDYNYDSEEEAEPEAAARAEATAGDNADAETAGDDAYDYDGEEEEPETLRGVAPVAPNVDASAETAAAASTEDLMEGEVPAAEASASAEVDADTEPIARSSGPSGDVVVEGEAEGPMTMVVPPVVLEGPANCGQSRPEAQDCGGLPTQMWYWDATWFRCLAAVSTCAPGKVPGLFTTLEGCNQCRPMDGPTCAGPVAPAPYNVQPDPTAPMVPGMPPSCMEAGRSCPAGFTCRSGAFFATCCEDEQYRHSNDAYAETCAIDGSIAHENRELMALSCSDLICPTGFACRQDDESMLFARCCAAGSQSLVGGNVAILPSMDEPATEEAGDVEAIAQGDKDMDGFCADPLREFLACGSACPAACGARGPRPCTRQCVQGCFCRQPYVLMDAKDPEMSQCVMPDSCEELMRAKASAEAEEEATVDSSVAAGAAEDGEADAAETSATAETSAETMADGGSSSDADPIFCADPLREFLACGSACPASCDGAPEACTAQCVPGCFCRKPYVLLDPTRPEESECVMEDTCARLTRAEDMSGALIDAGEAAAMEYAGTESEEPSAGDDTESDSMASGSKPPQEFCFDPLREYLECGSPCPASCGDGPQPRPCTRQCVRGCFCRQPYVLLDGRRPKESQCVIPDTCARLTGDTETISMGEKQEGRVDIEELEEVETEASAEAEVSATAEAAYAKAGASAAADATAGSSAGTEAASAAASSTASASSEAYAADGASAAADATSGASAGADAGASAISEAATSVGAAADATTAWDADASANAAANSEADASASSSATAEAIADASTMAESTSAGADFETDAGTEPIARRGKPGTCVDPHRVFKECDSACPDACGPQPMMCTMQCIARCACMEGFVLLDPADPDGSPCVTMDQCLGEGEVDMLGGDAGTGMDGPEGSWGAGGDTMSVARGPGPVSVCSMPPVTGRCRAAITNYYYDATAAKCLSFIYGGCEGNANNFVSEEQCEAECGAAARAAAGGAGAGAGVGGGAAGGVAGGVEAAAIDALGTIVPTAAQVDALG